MLLVARLKRKKASSGLTSQPLKRNLFLARFGLGCLSPESGTKWHAVMEIVFHHGATMVTTPQVSPLPGRHQGQQ